MSGFAEGYVDVAARIAEFYARYPDGSLQLDSVDILEVAGATFIKGRALAYRTPDDPRPGIGWAWESIPGRTPYTRGSELMNLETSAWGRALAALGIATRQGIATAQEVAAAQGDGPPADRQAAPRGGPASEKQVGYLERLMSQANMNEYQLADMASTVLGFTTPDNLTDLPKGHATQLIDALKRLLDGQVVTRHDGAPPDDPWAAPPIDPQTGEPAW